MEIRNLGELLAPALGKGKKLASYKAENLIGPGENYGSLMLKVDVKVKDEAGGDDEDLHLVAKMCPPSEFIKKMFNIPVTFKKEVAFYSSVVPTLIKFQKERGCDDLIDFLPKFYGSRVSLDANSNEVDDDACLLLENIKINGYVNGDRLKGFDLKTAEFLIKDLATFHAVPLALKLTHPEVFDEKIRPYLIRHLTDETLTEDMRAGLIKMLVDAAEKKPDLKKYVDRIESRFIINSKYYKETPGGREPFATMTHNDYWVNNTMVKYDSNGKPIANAMVDFQLMTYENPMCDLLFFIYSSLSNKIIADNYHGLIDLYYEHFIRVLKELGIDTTPFSYEAYLREIDYAAKEREFFHICFMLKPIYAEKETVKELSDLNEDEILETDSCSDYYYERLYFIMNDFIEKGWV